MNEKDQIAEVLTMSKEKLLTLLEMEPSLPASVLYFAFDRASDEINISKERPEQTNDAISQDVLHWYAIQEITKQRLGLS